MPVSVRYPQDVELEGGIIMPTTNDTWMQRNLVIETDRSEKEVRSILSKEGFEETSIEYPKPGRLGRGMVKKFKDWQIHLRLFRHDGNIQMDGEVEVSNEYCEHLTHGWLPAFDICADIIRRYFGGFWVYHKEYRLYAASLGRERVLSLGEPESKTSAIGLVAGVGLVAIGVGLLLASSKKD